jgi:hypothetical protein
MPFVEDCLIRVEQFLHGDQIITELYKANEREF